MALSRAGVVRQMDTEIRGRLPQGTQSNNFRVQNKNIGPETKNVCADGGSRVISMLIFFLPEIRSVGTWIDTLSR